MTAATAPILHFSPLETSRFGLRVYRASIEAVDADALADEIERERVDVAILRVPARALGTLNGLAQRGLAPIVADTLVRYETSLSPRNPLPAVSAPVTLREATHDDAELLAHLARAIFADYASHYHTNPLFAPDKILDGYAEWAARHVGTDDGSAAWLVECEGELAGFSCYRIDRPAGMAVGVLNGVLPAVRGRGVYRGMLRAMLPAFADLGMRRFEIATQVHNVAVQRVWTANGLLLRTATNTVHINALRGQVATTQERGAAKA